VTHPDRDHCNLINELLTDMNDSQGKLRIKFWIFSLVYGVGDVCSQTMNSVDLKMKELRFVVDKAYVQRAPLQDQSIFFVNAPIIDPKDKNANSMMLKVIIGGQTSVLLTGDATITTIAEMKYSHYIDRNLQKPKWEKNLIEWRLLRTVDYLVAPHHGADTKDSHLIAGIVNPKKGVIFSTVMYSQYSHPTFDAILEGLKPLTKESSIHTQPENLLYWANKEGLTNKQIVDKLAGTDTTLKFCYTFYDEIKDLVKATSPASTAQVNIPWAGMYCFATTKRQVYITGVHGTIQCVVNGCLPKNYGVLKNKTEEQLHLSNSEDDLRSFVENSTPTINYHSYAYTKFDRTELKKIYDEAIQKQRERLDAQEKLLAQTSAPVSSMIVTKHTDLEIEAMVDWKQAFGVWKVRGLNAAPVNLVDNKGAIDMRDYKAPVKLADHKSSKLLLI
jgi:hypothetical protein